MTKTAFIVLISVFILSSANAVVTMCKKKITYTSPDSCSNYNYANYADYGEVSGCSGSTVTDFQVWAGCSPNVYSGNYMAIETPYPISYASNQTAGRYCYCQIKSINGTAVASARWVFHGGYGSASLCASLCANSCAYNAQNDSGFRSALFSALN